VKASQQPSNETRYAYVAIEAKQFDKIPPIVEKLSKIDGWKGVSQLISINSLIAQGKYDEAQKEIGQLKVPIARDEFTLKVLEAKKDYKAMRDELNAMEKRLSPGVDVDLANALRQLIVAEKLRDVELLNRVWKLLADTKQIESPDAANSVGYVAAELNVRLDEAESDDAGAYQNERDVMRCAHALRSEKDDGGDRSQSAGGIADRRGNGKLDVAQSDISERHGENIEQGDRQIMQNDIEIDDGILRENFIESMDSHDKSDGRDHFQMRVFILAVAASDLGKQIRSAPKDESDNGKKKPTHNVEKIFLST